MNQVPIDPTLSSLRPISATRVSHFDGDDPTWAIAATGRRQVPVASEAAPKSHPKPPWTQDFGRQAPTTLEETGLRATQVESLILKFLLKSE